MNTGKLINKIVLVPILIASLSTIFSTVTTAQVGTISNLTLTSSEQEILDATVQIYLYPNDQIQGMQVYERGLGTLISLNGEYLIYTHDHWNWINDSSQVEFRNAQGEKLLEISGERLNGLIRYRDSGSLVLTAPVELRPDYLSSLTGNSHARFGRTLLAANPGNLQKAVIGENVLVARRDPNNSEVVKIMAAQIDNMDEWEGKHIYRLRSLEGETLVPGDSGGGVWLKGQLIGNNWMSEREYDWRIWKWDTLKPGTRYLDSSIAAAFPAPLTNAATETIETTAVIADGSKNRNNLPED